MASSPQASVPTVAVVLASTVEFAGAARMGAAMQPRDRKSGIIIEKGCCDR